MKEFKTVVMLSLAAMVFRIFIYLIFSDRLVVGGDQVQNILLARRFAAGDFYGVLDTYWTPLYPILIGIVSYFIDSLVVPSVILSVIAGGLAAPLTFYLVKQSYGRREAVIAAVLAVFFAHLINSFFALGTENIYLLLMTGALIVGWRGLKNDSAIDYLLTGILLGLAYITRPEAFGYPLFFVLLAAGKNWYSGKLFKRETAIQISALLLGFALFAAPYLGYLRSASGYWTISGKTAINTITGELTPDALGKEDKAENPGFDYASGKVLAKAFAENLVVIHKSFTYFYPPLLLFLVALGLFGESWNKERLRREAYLILFCFATILGYAVSTVQTRYFFILLPVFFGWTACGIVYAERWLHESFQKWLPGKFFYLINSKSLVAFFLLIIYIYVLPINSFMMSKETAWQEFAYEERDAGLWLKQQNPSSSPLIFSASLRPAFYAEARHLPPKTTDVKEILEQIKIAGVDYVVSGERSVKRNPFLKDFTEILQKSPEFELVYQKNDYPGYNISIFKPK